MQFHLDGFKGSGDPLKLQFSGSEPDFQASLPSHVDVLIIGAGPAGLLLATQLAQFPCITTRLVETKHGRLEQGQADGLQCRTIEIFEAFGFSEKVLKEAYWVNETTFWSPGGPGEESLRRSGRIRDTEEGLSEFPHVILNQARMHDFWLEAMKWSPTRLEPSYCRKMVDLKLPQDPCERVSVTIERIDEAHAGETETVHARYVVGCDGARSGVRKALGLQMRGDFSNQGWGVLDAFVVTDFPDIRLKSAIHSADEGSILIIPREGGYLVRFYVMLETAQDQGRLSSRNITAEILVDRAKRIFQPYSFDVREIAYWSVYEVGQRLTDHFDNVPSCERESRTPNVFIAGDACHTHSAKAGQGMNVSMNDTYNLGWKLAAVLMNRAQPSLLHTYSQERQVIAQQLISFDHEISKMFAAKPKGDNGGVGTDSNSSDKVVDPATFQAYFTRQGRFMAGVETCYAPSMITSSDEAHQKALAQGYKVGTRFQSTQVLRFADAKPVHLGHVIKADGRWRIFIFSDKHSSPKDRSSQFSRFCDFLGNRLVPRYTSPQDNVDAVLDIRAVFPGGLRGRQSLHMSELPSILLPAKGKLGIQDYEKAFTDEPSYGFGFGEVYKTKGIDAQRGCVVVVRPDQYISAVVPLTVDEGGEILTRFFDGVLVRQDLPMADGGR